VLPIVLQQRGSTARCADASIPLTYRPSRHLVELALLRVARKHAGQVNDTAVCSSFAHLHVKSTVVSRAVSGFDTRPSGASRRVSG